MTATQPTLFEEMPRMSNTQLSNEAKSVLSQCTISGNIIRISTQLTPDLYGEVNEALIRMGGRWKGGRTKGHVFEFDPTELLKTVIATGQLPHKNPLAFFPSPPPVVAMIREELSDFWWLAEKGILEPSAGHGALADIVTDADHAQYLTTIEINPLNCAVLRRNGYTPIEGDFLTHTGSYGIILMNPPFSVEGDKTAYITHLQHAWSMLTDPGVLVSVVPVGWLHSTSLSSFRDFVFQHGIYYQLPSNVFASAGTNADTAIIRLEKDSTGQARLQQPHCGHPSYATWQVVLSVETDSGYDTKVKRLLSTSDRQSLSAIKAKLSPLIQQTIKETLKTIREAGANIWLTPNDQEYLLTHLCEQEMQRNSAQSLLDEKP